MFGKYHNYKENKAGSLIKDIWWKYFTMFKR